MRNILVKRRKFHRDAKVESRAFCPCELCRLRFGRMLYSRKGGEPLRSYRRYRPALLLALAVALAAAFPVFAAPREPYACRLHADARRQCAFGNCDHRRLHRLERECLRDGGRP
jgi:hypothetical protein